MPASGLGARCRRFKTKQMQITYIQTYIALGIHIFNVYSNIFYCFSYGSGLCLLGSATCAVGSIPAASSGSRRATSTGRVSSRHASISRGRRGPPSSKMTYWDRNSKFPEGKSIRARHMCLFRNVLFIYCLTMPFFANVVLERTLRERGIGVEGVQGPGRTQDFKSLRYCYSQTCFSGHHY